MNKRKITYTLSSYEMTIDRITKPNTNFPQRQKHHYEMQNIS